MIIGKPQWERLTTPLPATPQSDELIAQLKTPEGRNQLLQAVPSGRPAGPFLMQDLQAGSALTWEFALKFLTENPTLLVLGWQALLWGFGVFGAWTSFLLFATGSEIRFPRIWFVTFFILWVAACLAGWLMTNVAAWFRNSCVFVAHPWLAVAMGVLLFWFLLLRISWGETLLILSCCILVYFVIAHPLRRTIVPIAVFAFLIAWTLVSGIAGFWRGRAKRAIPSEADRKIWQNRRATWAKGWKGPNVAVALSGGGYRAAAVHAGVLSVLDRAQIPIHVLSTVSGGSIVGAAFESGWTPEAFKNYLAAERPGLIRDYLHIRTISAEFWVPSYNSGDTLDRHFSDVFFQDTRLADTGPGQLLINSTDFSNGARAVFRNHRPGPDYPLSRVVAASAAFPGAFEPVMIDGRPYVDGGIIENLGVEGLARYLDEVKNETTPGLVIISDVSESPPAVTGRKFLPTDQFLRAADLFYAELHKKIFSLLSGGRYAPNGNARPDQPYVVDAGVLWPGREGKVRIIILAPTSNAESKLFAGDKSAAAMVAMVRNISTLAEPSPEQVNAAFKAGATIANAYLPAIMKF